MQIGNTQEGGKPDKNYNRAIADKPRIDRPEMFQDPDKSS